MNSHLQLKFRLGINTNLKKKITIMYKLLIKILKKK